jgi:hypothetical protein
VARVVLCQPVYGHVPPAAHLSQVELVLHAGTHGSLIGIVHAKDTYLDWGRNHCVRQAYEHFGDFTHLFWLDSDIIAPPDSLARLLHDIEDRELPDVGAVGGLYFKKGPPYEPVAYDFEVNEEGRYVGTYERTRKLDVTTDALQLVHGLGLGLTLVTREAMDAVNHHTSGAWFQTTLHFGEDVWFFHWLSQLGYTTFLDTSIKCRHIGDYEYTLADWERHRDE